MRRDPNDLRLQICLRILPKKRTLKNFLALRTIKYISGNEVAPHVQQARVESLFLLLLDLVDFAWQEQPEDNLMVAISRAWYNGSYTMAAKRIKSLELQYSMIQFLIMQISANCRTSIFISGAGEGVASLLTAEREERSDSREYVCVRLLKRERSGLISFIIIKTC